MNNVWDWKGCLFTDYLPWSSRNILDVTNSVIHIRPLPLQLLHHFEQVLFDRKVSWWFSTYCKLFNPTRNETHQTGQRLSTLQQFNGDTGKEHNFVLYYHQLQSSEPSPINTYFMKGLLYSSYAPAFLAIRGSVVHLSRKMILLSSRQPHFFQVIFSHTSEDDLKPF